MSLEVMVKININGKTHEVQPGNNLLHTCLALGFDIPYFCYHPALGSVGACRQCAVKKHKDPDDAKGKIIMSCMEPVTDGLIITTDDKDIREFRASVIEALMINHPHDCPVCDEGSECHLQDMTVMTGHAYRRYDFKKRTHNNQYLGQFINHEMNRCIQCYRCVRYYREYAGGKDLNVFGSASRVWFGRHEDGALESMFSGNLVEVCPTGVFTDNTFKNHYTRKWDLANAPSICNHCSVGCNIIIGERYGTIRRIRSRYNSDVNGYFICDRGRFGYEYINSDERIRKPITKSRYSEPDESEESLQPELIQKALAGKRIAGIGSPRASLESNFALLSLVGPENFYHGISRDEFVMVEAALKMIQESPAHIPSLKEIEQCDAVLILGEDPVKTAPMIALAVRQAARNKSFEKASASKLPLWNDAAVRELGREYSPVIIATMNATRLDDLAMLTFRESPGKIAELGFLIASNIDNSAPSPKTDSREVSDLAEKISGILKKASRPLIITGFESRNINVLNAVSNITNALAAQEKQAFLSIIFPDCNSLGLGLFEGKPIDDLLAPVLSEDIDTVVIIESNLYKIAGGEIADAIFEKCSNVIVINHSRNETTERADMVVPGATFAESTGTIVNFEGRAQRYFSVLPEDVYIKDKWKHLAMMIRLAGKDDAGIFESHEEIEKLMIAKYPVLSKISDLAHSSFRIHGEKIPRQSRIYSGRTAMYADIDVHEQRPPDDKDSPLSFSMEGHDGITPGEVTTSYWSPGWNSPQAINKYLDEPGGKDGILFESGIKKLKTGYFNYK